MFKKTIKKANEHDIERALDEAFKQYEVYIQLQDINSVIESSLLQENYDRDMSHPLSIQIKG